MFFPTATPEFNYLQLNLLANNCICDYADHMAGCSHLYVSRSHMKWVKFQEYRKAIGL